MKKKSVDDNISTEVLAAYLDGNATDAEIHTILDAMAEDAELRELMRISQCVDAELGMVDNDMEFLPLTAMAATCDEGNNCCLECEKYILQQWNIEYDEKAMLQDAVQNKWLKEQGTVLHHVGRHLEKNGLVVIRRYHCTLEDIEEALLVGDSIIAAVDGGELNGNPIEEWCEDMMTGEIPDHTVVIKSYNPIEKTMEIYNPDSPKGVETYAVSCFLDAWKDSKCYLVTINLKDMKTYNPQPIDLSNIELPEELNELREALAENAHDVWAVERMAQGWTYGPKRDDDKKETPCMVPYSQLPESEKKFDRDMAESSLKLVKAVGYEIIKKEDTELYRLLKQRLLDARQEFHCPECQGLVSKHQVFCDHCGKKLEIDWKLYK